MTGKEVAIREQGGGGALQPELAAAGVHIVEDDGGGFRSIEFPDELRKKFNILLPVSEVVQADPNYTPSIRAATLPVEAYFYNQGTQREPRWAPLKQALEVLADLAGVQLAAVKPLPMVELAAYPEGSFGFSATISIRRSDGTPRTITRSRIWNAEVEKEKIVNQIAKIDGKTDAWKQAEFRRRWLQEREHGPAKTESKAVLRAIRAALQIPHTFTAADVKKPFVVVGYSFTPDYSDPEVRRLVVERGLSAGAEVYGGEGGAASLPEGSAEAGAEPSPAPAEGVEEADASDRPSASSPAFEGEEPPAEEEPPEEPEAAASDEADYVLPAQFTRYAGLSLAEVPSEDYLAWLASDAVKDDQTRAAAQAFLAARSKPKKGAKKT